MSRHDETVATVERALGAGGLNIHAICAAVPSHSRKTIHMCLKELRERGRLRKVGPGNRPLYVRVGA